MCEHFRLKALGAGLPTPPTLPTAGLQEEETSGQPFRRGQETRAERFFKAALEVGGIATINKEGEGIGGREGTVRPLRWPGRPALTPRPTPLPFLFFPL